MKEGKENDLQKMQQCQLNILKEFKKACDKNQVRFYLAFGTALGAVRHKGFIPWDDDIDICMRIEDMLKLKKIQSSLPSNLYIQTRDNEKEYGLLIARVRDSNTTLIEADHVNRDINHGIYIDIYPLFYCPENNLKRKWVVLLSFLCRLFAYNAPPMNKGGFTTFVAKLLLSLFTKQTKRRIADKLYHYIISRPSSKYLAFFPDISTGRHYLNEWFTEPTFCEFEGEKMPLPTNPHEYLTRRYGNYVQLPPIEERQIHHNYLFVDFDISYVKYKGVKYCKISK